MPRLITVFDEDNINNIEDDLVELAKRKSEDDWAGRPERREHYILDIEVEGEEIFEEDVCQ